MIPPAVRDTIAVMSGPDRYTVWLLGAGFSRALGGPLLDDLFRPRHWLDDDLVFPAKLYPALSGDLCLSRLLCETGKAEGRWRDAEEFLAFVDAAYRNEVGSGRGIGILRLMFERMSSRGSISPAKTSMNGFDYAHARFLTSPVPVRRALAAECAAFLRDLDGKEEIWHPYRTWASSLDPQWDTVISFNYDRVLEELAADDKSKLKILLPCECPKGPSDQTKPPPDVVPVLKLHGIVDWKKNDSGEIVQGEWKEILADENASPFIAAPGRSKQDAVEEQLVPLWEQAKRALKEAQALVILGYGFPATDTKARTEIQTAFAAHPKVLNTTRRIDVVLGPDTNRPEARRVESLLETFDPNRSLVISPGKVGAYCHAPLYLKSHQLWAQDFIFDYRERMQEPV